MLLKTYLSDYFYPFPKNYMSDQVVFHSFVELAYYLAAHENDKEEEQQPEQK